MKVAGKVVVVTGAGSGIGRALAQELLKRGARVAAVDVNADTLAQTAAQLQDAVHLTTLVADVTDHTAVDALPDQVIDRFGVVDGVINCAGIIQPFERLQDLSWAAIDRVFAVNWSGTLWLTKALLPHLLRRPVAHVVNVASMGAFLPVPGQTIYGASKAAVMLLTEGLHAELKDTRVRVTLALPGAVATNITTNSGVSVPAASTAQLAKRRVRPIAAADAARQILDGMERDAWRVLVGPDARMMDALVRLDPRRAAAFIGRQMKALLP
jgi:short-subunit dehydrogenase